MRNDRSPMPDDKDLNFDALRAVAKAATPGPWITGSIPWKVWAFGGNVTLAENFHTVADRDFIATFNPALVLRLLDLAEKGAKK